MATITSPAPLAPPPGVDLWTTPQRGPRLALKRAFDLVVSATLLLLTAPVLALSAMGVRLTSPGPALHREIRIGRHGRPFTAYKLRSMVADADPHVHEAYLHGLLDAEPGSRAIFKMEDDPRVTSFGRFLRRTSLDELPQLFNVLRGEMSLVGPRPEVPYALGDYEDWWWRRFTVLPGMTGLWQVRGRGCLPPREMLRLDVEYADTWSLRLDARILLRTIPAVLTERGSR